MKRSLSAVLAMFFIVAFAPNARAQGGQWNVVSGDWNTAGNWGPTSVPISSTFVIIGTTTTNLTANITTANAFSAGATIGISSGNIGTVNVLNGRTWTNGSDFWVGRDGNGTLNIQSGGKVTTNTSAIGYGSGSTGTTTVTGAGSEWTSATWLDIGFSGNGTLNIESGGKVSNGAPGSTIGYASGSTGSVTVTGSGSQWSNSGILMLGDSGNGTLTVAADGKATATTVTMADSDSAQGTLNLNGTTGSRGVLETGYLSEGSGSQGARINFNGGILRATGNQANFLQNFETGDLQIQSGGAFFDTNGYNVTIAPQFSSTGGITKQGAGTLTLSGDRTYSGNNFVEGGTLANAVGYVDGISMNAMTVTGSGSQWTNTAHLHVGYGSTGTLNIENGGQVSNTQGTLGFGNGTTGSATVTDAGSQWNNSSGLLIGGFGNGTLTVTAGGKVMATGGITLAVVGNGKGTLNLNGTTGSRGVLETGYLSEGSGSQGATINFNGGILRATGNQTDFLQNFEAGDVQIQSGGAFVDTQALNVGISTALQGAGGLTKEGAGELTLSGNNTYTGATMVLQGKVLVDGSIAASSGVDVSSGATLGGHGMVSTITGAGTVSAGNSPGILTATVIDPSGGLDFLFEMTQTGSPFYDQAAASGNDVLRLTGATPFTSALGAGNLITVDFTGYGALSNGLVFRGGFYADNGGDFYSQIQNASFNYLGLGVGESVLLSTVLDSANFAGGSSNGYVTQFTIVVPEPSRVMLLVVGLTGGILRRRRKNV